MSSKKRVLKRSNEICEGNGSCRSFPKFTVSSCPIPIPPVPVFTPVYGSLYTNETIIAESGTNVVFDEKGPSSGVTLDLVNNSITVDSPGVYNIIFTTMVLLVSGVSREIVLALSINGNPIGRNVGMHNHFTGDEYNTLSRTDQITLNQGDVIRYFISLVNGDVRYYSAALVVTKVT